MVIVDVERDHRRARRRKPVRLARAVRGGCAVDDDLSVAYRKFVAGQAAQGLDERHARAVAVKQNDIAMLQGAKTFRRALLDFDHLPRRDARRHRAALDAHGCGGACLRRRRLHEERHHGRSKNEKYAIQ